MNKKIRNFLNLIDIDKTSLRKILNRAASLKKKRLNLSQNINSLKNINLAMIFEKPSTRTRVSFELAIQELGGRAVILDETNTHLSRGETIADTARVLSRYCNILMVRTNKHKKLMEYYDYSGLPVINGLSDKSHPCQILADILTFEENKKNIENSKITWLGDVNNVLYSWMEAANIFKFNLRISYPKKIKIESFFNKMLNNKSKYISIIEDPIIAVKGSDCVVTDTWFSMGNKTSKKMVNMLKPYQVNKEIMSSANRNAIFMHCLPASRNNEVTTEIIEDKKISVVWDEAENRLHVQKAILEWCLEKI